MKPANGLEIEAPQTGAGADAYNVAVTALVLSLHARARLEAELGPDEVAAQVADYARARHAVTLHRLSGQLHRINERQCNEDLTCHRCAGSGAMPGTPDDELPAMPCAACAGRGNTLGRREARIEQQCQDIAEHYGLRAYFQGDPRGCSLYLIDPRDIPTGRHELSGYLYPMDGKDVDPLDHPIFDTLQTRWIAANYNRGHAVVRLGR